MSTDLTSDVALLVAFAKDVALLMAFAKDVALLVAFAKDVALTSDIDSGCKNRNTARLSCSIN
jgi:hypothetical protein